MLGNSPSSDSTFSILRNTTPIYSSFGEMSRLGLFDSFRPEAKNEVLTVEDLYFTIRLPFPSYTNFLYEYNGQLQVSLVVGGKYSSLEELEMYFGIFRELFSSVI